MCACTSAWLSELDPLVRLLEVNLAKSILSRAHGILVAQAHKTLSELGVEWEVDGGIAI